MRIRWIAGSGFPCGRQTLLLEKTSPLESVTQYSELRLRGVSDQNGGGRINHYCVGSVVEVFGANGYQARNVEDDSVHFGFGSQPPKSFESSS